MGPVGPIGEPVSVFPRWISFVAIYFIVYLRTQRFYFLFIFPAFLQGDLGEQGPLGPAGKPGARVSNKHIHKFIKYRF